MGLVLGLTWILRSINAEVPYIKGCSIAYSLLHTIFAYKANLSFALWKCLDFSFAKYFFFNSFLFLLFYFLTLQYCIGFAIYQHEFATGIHVVPILNPPPSSFPIPFLWVDPVHQPQASSIMHQTWTGDSFLI